MTDSTRRQHQTGGSAALADLALRFGGWFSNDKFGSYMARLQEPTGMSTQGGKQALQHIQLTDVGGDGPTITVGWLNAVASEGKVRTFDVLQTMHQQRHGQPLPFDQKAYQSFLGKLEVFMRDEKLVLDVERAAPPMSQRGAASAASGSSSTLWLLLGFAAIAAAAAAYFLSR